MTNQESKTKKNSPPYHASNPFRELKTSQLHEGSYYAYGINNATIRLEECLLGEIGWNKIKDRIRAALLIMEAITTYEIRTRTDPEAATNDQIVDYIRINNAERISRTFLEQENRTVAHRQYQHSDRTELFTDSNAFVIDLKKLDNLIY